LEMLRVKYAPIVSGIKNWHFDLGKPVPCTTHGSRPELSGIQGFETYSCLAG